MLFFYSDAKWLFSPNLINSGKEVGLTKKVWEELAATRNFEGALLQQLEDSNFSYLDYIKKCVCHAFVFDAGQFRLE